MVHSREIWQPLTKPEIIRTRFDPELATLRKYWRLVREQCRSEPEFALHTERLLRRVVIETGQIEGVYDLDRGTTEILIERGYEATLLGHGNAGPVSAELAVDLLRDQELAYRQGLDAVVGGMDIVVGTRELGESIVRELHSVLTRSQEFAEGRDADGNRMQIPLLRGEYKRHANNPTRADGTLEAYCPPEQVGPQVEALFRIYRELEGDGADPVFLAAWFHHAFVSIHPFQDGNGRLARLLASIILVKHGLLYLHVERGEPRADYLEALRAADGGVLERFVAFVARAQKSALLDAVRYVSTSATDAPVMGATRLERAIERARRAASMGSGEWHDKVRGAFFVVHREVVELSKSLQAQLDREADSIQVHATAEDSAHDAARARAAALAFKLDLRPGSPAPRCELGVTGPSGQRTASFWAAEPACAVRGLVLGFAHLDDGSQASSLPASWLPVVGDLDSDIPWTATIWSEIAHETAAHLLESLSGLS